MRSNTGLFRFDEGERTMQYIAQAHMYQSWISATNSNQYLSDESNVGLHQTTLAIRVGSVGIGTSQPITTLDVNGDLNIRGTINIPSYVFQSSNQSTVLTVRQLTPSCNIAAFYQGSQPALIVGANVGIGTSTPTAKLHVWGSAAMDLDTGPLRIASSSATSVSPYLFCLGKRNDPNTSYAFAGRIGLAKHHTNDFAPTGSTLGMIAFGGNSSNAGESNVSFASSIVGISEQAFSNAETMSTAIAFFTGNSGTSMNTANQLAIGKERMRITSAGNIGVGTTTPAWTLDVKGPIRTTDQLVSTITTGTPPLLVTSTTLTSNLNADYLDGQHGSFYQNMNNVSAGTLAVQYGGTGLSNITQNKLLVGNGSNAIITPTLLHWSGTSLGIGTSTPTDALHVIGTIRTSSNFISTLATGIAPLTVASRTMVANLNADLLDGQEGTFYQNATNINAGTLNVLYGGTGSNLLTANKLLVGNGSNAILTPTSLHWSGVSLGVGTSTPTDSLHVVGAIRTTSNLVSTLATGTAPLIVASSTLVSNLNADLLDGQDGTYYQNANNINAGTLNVLYGGTGSNVLTANKLLVGNGSNAILTPTSLHWSGTSLGIGTSTPIDALHVVGAIRTTSNLVSTLATGTAPLIVASSTLVSNLNADLLDGQDGTYYQNATNINAGTLGVLYGGTGQTTFPENKLLVGNSNSPLLSPTALHWDNVNSRLGVGTTTPQASIDVQGGIRAIELQGACIQNSFTISSSNTAASGKALVDGLATKQNILTGASTTIASNDLAVSKALISDVNGKVSTSVVSSTELSYLLGTTDVIQNQLNALGALLPTGSILMWGGTISPSGYLLCNGSYVLRASYPNLFAVIGIIYGSTDVSNFRLPDLRNRFPMGTSDTNAQGTYGGSSSVTLSTTNMPSHNHGVTVTDPGHSHGVNDPGHQHLHNSKNNAFQRGAASTGNYYWEGDVNRYTSSASTGISLYNSSTGISVSVGNVGGGAAFSVLNPYCTVNYIIKT